MKSEKKTGADRAQPSVTNEWWSDERVKTYLDLQTAGDEATDFHVLQKAYRGRIIALLIVSNIFLLFYIFFTKLKLDRDGLPRSPRA